MVDDDEHLTMSEPVQYLKQDWKMLDTLGSFIWNVSSFPLIVDHAPPPEENTIYKLVKISTNHRWSVFICHIEYII